MTYNEDNRLPYQKTWKNLRDEAADFHEAFTGSSRRTKHLQTALKEAFRDYLLLCYSESVRLELGTEWAPLEGLEGARLIAMEKMRLMPLEARELDNQTLAHVLHRELHGFTLPEQAAEACRFDLSDNGLYPMIQPHLRQGA
ncbi:hypothetical protein SAMN05216571_101383 [Onishia taeanensis]|uniref:Uncharacterized protein n=1 Tax=Onishia taeanensis TaxID=284577 RepID=A0A1G7NFX3_9GAMM|nr:hypothetical protein SAMN05216571_101383 [Halomonas taeanensis]